jgi:hypothetical protein
MTQRVGSGGSNSKGERDVQEKGMVQEERMV